MAETAALEEDNHEPWDKCIRHGAWTVGLGMLVGTAASVFMASETPLMMVTGLGVGWAMKYCRSQFRQESQRKELLRQQEEEEKNIVCSCCPETVPPQEPPDEPCSYCGGGTGPEENGCGENESSLPEEKPAEVEREEKPCGTSNENGGTSECTCSCT